MFGTNTVDAYNDNWIDDFAITRKQEEKPPAKHPACEWASSCQTLDLLNLQILCDNDVIFIIALT